MLHLSLHPKVGLVLASLLLAACAEGPAAPLAPADAADLSRSGYRPATPSTLNEQLMAVRVATARFHSITQAEMAGYTATTPCVESPSGVMGIHRIHLGLRADPALHPLQPEMLLYVPERNGKLRLVGVEYFVWEADWQALHGPDAPYPTLFGQTFVRGTHGIPPHYELHVWLWSENPLGMFALWNPTLSC